MHLHFTTYNISSNHGFGLLEILISSAIISASLVALAAASQVSFRIIEETARRTQAEFLAEEGIEAVRILRDASWSENIEPLSLETTYYPVFDSGMYTWSLSAADPGLLLNFFRRTLVFQEVCRKDSDDDIVSCGSTEPHYTDPDTREVVSRAVWGTTEEKKVFFEDGTTDGNLASFPSDNAGDGDPAQSITTGISEITAATVSLLLKRVSDTTPSDVYLEIRRDSTVGAVVATSEEVTASTIPDSALSWTRFTFATPPMLSAGTKYYLRLRSNPDSTVPFSGSSGTIHWGYKQTVGSPYAGGDAYRYVGRNDNPSDTGQLLDQYDFSFRIYKETIGAREVEFRGYITDIFNN